MYYVTQGKGLTPVVSINKAHHPAISPEQDASKIVKISQQMAKLCRKLKWLVFLGHGVYYAATTMKLIILCIND